MERLRDRYREYNPVRGSWLSPDLSGLSAVDPTHPQSWSRYAYVNNGPLANVDLNGLSCYPGIEESCSAWEGTDYFSGGSCDPTASSTCIFNPRLPYWTSQGGGGGFSFGFDIAPGFGSGNGIWGEWQAPVPTSPGQAIRNIWDIAGLPSGLNCPQMGGVFGPLCGGVSPIMDATPTACAADVAINFALGFIPGYNAAKLVGQIAGLNFNFVQNITSGKSVITAGPSALGSLAALGSAYHLISLEAFKAAGGVSLKNLPTAGAITELGKIASTAGTIANVLNAASAGYDLYQCYQKQ